jgi:TRAP-type C4-dicarboxylate transport system permease large subunit
VFSLVFRGLGGEALVEEALRAMPGGKWGALVVCMAVMFVLGFFLDTFEILFIMVPIFGAPLIVMGFDPLWLGIMIAVNLQTSFLTPPFGFTLFYLRSVAPARVATADIWRGAVPFVGLQVLGLVLLASETRLATWLPGALFRSPGAIARDAGEGAPATESLDQLIRPGDFFGPGSGGGIDNPFGQPGDDQGQSPAPIQNPFQ